MNSLHSEQAVITAIQSRSVTAAEMLYDLYAVNLHKVILSIVKEPELAFQVLEQTFLTIWNSFDEFNHQEKRFGIWTMGIARKVAKAAVYQPETTIYMKSKIHYATARLSVHA
jgi:DNA-directed RNA polymerase specialized sigma24 family protein